MKRILCVFSCLLMLAGCANTPPTVPTTEPAPAASEPTVPPETTAPATEPAVPPTEPPDTAEVLLEQMSVEEKVGQLFLARCPDFGAIADIQTYHLGGFVLFGRDIEDETPESLRNTLAEYQAASRIPMLIAVDEEGGTVTRISDNDAFRSDPFPSPRSLYENGGLMELLTVETEKSQLLASIGINVNLAPVCDVTTDPAAFMYDRSLGLSPEETGKCIAAMVRVMHLYGVGSVLKHFPGYGNNTDTHIAAAVDDRSYEELMQNDLVPFQCGIDVGCGAVMVSHTIISAIDPQYPASLSPAVNRLLREEMGFDGVIITDDLAMDAITDTYGNGECAVLAVLAGNDLLCCTYYSDQYEAVLEAVMTGRIAMETLDSAVLRVLRWKESLGLI